MVDDIGRHWTILVPYGPHGAAKGLGEKNFQWRGIVFRFDCVQDLRKRRLSGQFNTDTAQLPGRPDKIILDAHMITPDFPDLYGMHLVAGRMLSDTRGEDVVVSKMDPANEGHNILINESAAARFG